jgi:hypothetical protein
MGNQEFYLSAMMDELLPQLIIKSAPDPIKSPQVNYCRANEYFDCQATDSAIQKSCKYYIESFSGGYCIFLNMHQCCDNPEAQRHARALDSKTTPVRYR